MRKIFLALICLLILGTCIYLFLARQTATDSEIASLEILNVGNYQVTIAWETPKKHIGKVFYTTASSDSPPLSAMDSRGKRNRHEVILTGLQPSTSYIYWIEGSENQFQFQTQPLPSSPFSFLIVFGDVSDRIIPLMASEMPDFIVSLTQQPENIPDWFAEVRPYIPIYGPTGVNSPFLKEITTEPGTAIGPWEIYWGGTKLVFVSTPDEITEIKETLEIPSAQLFGIITSTSVIKAFEHDTRTTEEQLKIDIQGTELHSLLIAHNKNSPSRPAAFVAVTGETDRVIELDNVRYFGIPAIRVPGHAENSGAIRVDIDVEHVAAIFLDKGTEVILRSPPLKQKRTCEECRRLADKGAYEESVNAYIGFIENNRGHYQIDDAYFAIAQILDEKLFRFGEALKWYTRLIDEYPSNTLSPLAKQRIKYLSDYSDFNYEPLMRFERIKKVEYERSKHDSQKREELLNKAAAITEQYPESKLTPIILYWISNQYRMTNADKAVNAYLELKEKFPEHPETKEVMIEIGETYYDAGKYNESITAYKNALSELPYLEEVINAQIKRCERNLRRIAIAYVSWGLIILMFVTGVIYKCSDIDRKLPLYSFPAFVILLGFIFIGAWLIREQFSSMSEMILFIILFPVIILTGAHISNRLTRMLFSKSGDEINMRRKIMTIVSGSILGIIFMIAGIYLAIYYIYAHYLIVFGL